MSGRAWQARGDRDKALAELKESRHHSLDRMRELDSEVNQLRAERDNLAERMAQVIR